MDPINDMTFVRAPTARRPLLGQTVLLVEDSRFASEAVRMMCLRSGARIRRADSLETAQRHLAVYHPTVVIVDVGLPDGSGLALIDGLSQAVPRIGVIIGTSGDSSQCPEVMEAGADGFIEKPVESLLAFQSAILTHVPADRQPPAPRLAEDERITPDPVAYQDDLAHVAQVLDGGEDVDLDYVTQFLGGVARSAQDHDLDQAITDLSEVRMAGRNTTKGVAVVSDMVRSRIAAAGPI